MSRELSPLVAQTPDLYTIRSGECVAEVDGVIVSRCSDERRARRVREGEYVVRQHEQGSTFIMVDSG